MTDADPQRRRRLVDHAKNSCVEGERKKRDDKAHAGQCDYGFNHRGSIGGEFLMPGESVVTAAERKREQARERRRLSRERRRRGQLVLGAITLLDEDATADLVRLTGHLTGEGREALRLAVENYINDMSRG